MKDICYPQEHMLSLRIQDVPSINLICTHADLRELIYEFLYNERLIESTSDVESMFIRDNTAKVVLRVELSPVNPIRGTGLGSVILDQKEPDYVFPIDHRYSTETIRCFAADMTDHAKYYHETGGMHCSALCDGNGIIASFEDIGRYNTIDKLTGYCLLHDARVSDCLLITTGRISQDMVRKAARLGASTVATYSTPTQQAVEAARKANITLIRYLGKSCTLCTVPERILR